MANSQVAMTEGSGKNAATYSISEGTTKEIQRMALNTNAGVEIGTSAAPVQVTLANTGANATAVKVDGSAVTQPVSLTSTTVTGTVAVTESGTWTVQPGNTANTTAWKVDNTSALDKGTGTGGSATQRIIVDSSQLASLGSATSSASSPVVIASDQGKIPVHGTVATNVAITANPLNLGAQAVSSENAVVTTARQVQLVSDLVGKLIVLPYSNPENFVSGVITSAMTGTTSTSLIAAPASGLRNYITQITVSNAHATVGTDVIIQDGSGGTTLYNIPAAAVYGGSVITFPTPLRQPTTATAIFCANVTTGASTKVSASGYKGV